MCCVNVGMLGGRANVLGSEGMPFQGGDLLPWTPLLRKRIFNSKLHVRPLGSARASLLHDLVEVRVDPSVSTWAAVQHGWQVGDQAVGMNTIRAGGGCSNCRYDEISASLHQEQCIWALQASSALVWVFSVLSSSAARALGSPGSRASSQSTNCLYCRVREGQECAAGEGPG